MKRTGDIILHSYTKNHDHKLYCSWGMVCDGCNYFSFWAIFALLQPWIFCPNSPKNQNFKTMKKMPGDIILLHKCTKNHDHMLYYSWDIARDRCNCYVLFWAIFCLFTPPLPLPPPLQKTKNSLKNENFKKMKKEKKHLEISFYISVPKIMVISHTVPEIWCVTDLIIFHFGIFLALLHS